MLSRRTFVQLGGGLAASLVLPRPAFAAPRVVDITMSGREDGSRVWFEPQGLQIMPGDTVRWTNNDPTNSHTATAYHPSLYDRPLRIPKRAEPWDSDYLLPGESFSVTFKVPGVYDYYCIPHEAAGMVGRLIVGNARHSAWMDAPDADAGIPEAALDGFPDIETILASGSVSANE